VLGNHPRHPDLEEVLNSLREERPHDIIHRRYDEHKQRRDDLEHVSEFLSTNGLSSRAIAWVLKRIPKHCALQWLFLKSTEATMYDMMFKYRDEMNKDELEDELDKLFRAVHKE